MLGRAEVKQRRQAIERAFAHAPLDSDNEARNGAALGQQARHKRMVDKRAQLHGDEHGAPVKGSDAWRGGGGQAGLHARAHTRKDVKQKVQRLGSVAALADAERGSFAFEFQRRLRANEGLGCKAANGCAAVGAKMRLGEHRATRARRAATRELRANELQCAA